MEKRFTAKADDNNISEAPDTRTRLVLVAVSAALILGIGAAAVFAIRLNRNERIAASSTDNSSQQTNASDAADVPVTKIGGEYPDGTVPTDCMNLMWGLPASEIKLKYPDVLSENPSSISDEKNTVNLIYERKASIGGFDFTSVMLSSDKLDGLYAFSYFLDKEQYQAILDALNEEYGKPVYRSGNSAYWELDERVLMNLTFRISDADGKEYAFLQYIDTKEPKATVKPDTAPELKLGMTQADARRKISMESNSVSPGGTETFISEKRYDFSSDANLGKFAAAYASAVLLNFDPKADLTSYSFVMRGDYLYEVREKLAQQYGNPSLNRDYSSEWNVSDGRAAITVSYGRMTGSGRGFATEIRYSISPDGLKYQELVKAVGRATGKGTKLAKLREEIGQYGPAENIKKGKGTVTLINKDNADIIVFGMRVISVEIEINKNAVTGVYYVFDGSAYQALKKSIETSYGAGEAKLNFKDRIHRYQWKPNITEDNKYTRMMLDFVNLKHNPKARIYYYS